MSDYEKHIINDLQEKIKTETPKIENAVLDTVEKKLKEFFEISVINFYSNYPNPKYVRRGSLYNLFRTRRDGNALIYWFEPSEFPSRTGYTDEDGLYTTVFLEGWHGGAKHDGKILYRTPIPTYKYWGDEAVRAPYSPYDSFIALKEDYEKHGFRKDYRNIWITHLNNVGIKVR